MKHTQTTGKAIKVKTDVARLLRNGFKQDRQAKAQPEAKQNNPLPWNRRNQYARRIVAIINDWVDCDIDQAEMERRVLQAIDEIKAERLSK